MSLFVDIKKDFTGFSLDVKLEPGKGPLGILGASGSGKSMTLKCIAGIETPDRGLIMLNGKTLFDSEKRINLKPQKRKVGYLFQSYALFPHMTVEQNIACAVDAAKAEKRKMTAELIKRYKLGGLEKHYPSQLSGGQQQRVALARILACEPEVLLLDEPFSALDAHLKETLLIELKKTLEHYRGDVVVVTHNRDETYRLCECLTLLDNGAVKASGNVRQLFREPGNLTAARLTGCKNFSRAEKVSGNTIRALDWNCVLTVCAPIPDKLTHIGVRAHYFKPCDGDAQNAIPVELKDAIEGPFDWDILFQIPQTGGAGTIWWKCSKESRPDTTPRFLCVPPERIHLLTDA